MNLDMINRYDRAVELLALDARIKIVTEQTGHLPRHLSHTRLLQTGHTRSLQRRQNVWPQVEQSTRQSLQT